MANQTVAGMNRRQALRKGAAAGAVIWTVPMVVSNKALATGGGSPGAVNDGKLKSITCAWIGGYYRPSKFTSLKPPVDLSNASFCEISIGSGPWTVISKGDLCTIPAGDALRCRPLHGMGLESALPPDAPIDELPADETPVDTSSTTTTTVPVVEPAKDEAVETPVGGTTAATTTAAPADETTTTVASALPPVETNEVDTIVIDMSGRSEINIGDVYGYFQVVDAEPA